MVDNATFRRMVLSFNGVVEQPHFERAAFKVVNKKIFASLHEATNSANIALTPEEQSVFCQFNKKIVYPVPNKFGLQGWTTFELSKASEELVAEALLSAYNNVMQSKSKR